MKIDFSNARKLEIKVKSKSTGQVQSCIIDVANCDKDIAIQTILDEYTKKLGHIYWAIRVIE